MIKSPINSNITISYKQPDAGTCTTVFPGQKQYTGYINIPRDTLAPIQQDYPINTFFWFVEARQRPNAAPLTVWLNGGPGSSSLIGFFQETGPCQVVQVADGSYGTQPRLWGFDRSSNVLFIDQPAQVGFSYDTPTNFSLNLLSTSFNTPGPVAAGTPPFAWLNGTFGSQSQQSTANTTEIAAHTIWHFLQSWLAAFPQYNPGSRPNSTATGPAEVNLFTESYGGLYGPTFANLWETMNQRRRNGTIPAAHTVDISLASLGIINGLVDTMIQTPFYPKFAFNNTYGIKAIDQTTMYNTLQSVSQPGGCNDLIMQCRAAGSLEDPDGDGDVEVVNAVCSSALQACNKVIGVIGSALDVYDIRQNNPSPFPSESYLEYVNNGAVMQSIGVPVNFTESSAASFDAFISTGDQMRGGQLQELATLLSMNVRVALIYGDADYICNWYGGEAISLALAELVPEYANTFSNSGYAEIVINSSYVAGEVRQYGNLSFARIYDAGHQIPAYQPEAAFTVFTRVMDGTAVSTGETVDLSLYGTSGPANSTHQNKAPSSADPVCWARNIQLTCTQDEMNEILAGNGVVIDGVWYQDASDYSPPSTSIVAGMPGRPMPNATAENMAAGSSKIQPTGVYTATATPKSAAVALEATSLAWWICLAVVAVSC